MRTQDFDFALPNQLIARYPAEQRDQSRLLILDRRAGTVSHRNAFRQLLEWLHPGDVLVVNNSRVLPARLRARKQSSGGEIELLLLEEIRVNEWWAMVRPGKRVRIGTRLELLGGSGNAGVGAEVIEKNEAGHCQVRFTGAVDIRGLLEAIGEIPLPPYLDRAAEAMDRERYQTVYAASLGSVAAPTAGLHFTSGLLEEIRARGIEIREVTLHVGLGTFAPVKADRVEEHRMHEESFVLHSGTVSAIQAARSSGGKVIAVGTTTVRVLESVAAAGGELTPGAGRTSIFIHPPYRFKVVDALVTNFHLPRSTLLMLVSAFAAPGDLRGREMVLAAYAEAVRLGYRFFSYGDAMLIV